MNHKKPAFTIVELLIVVTIIALLVGILVPAINKVKENAKTVATSAQLNAIARACDAYKAQFHNQGYPGYITDSQVENNNNFSANENLVISLLGGVIPLDRADEDMTISSTGTKIFFDDIGRGPAIRSGRRYGAFYQPQDDELKALDNTGSSEDNMPELVDKSTGMPILYYRAQKAQSRPVTPALSTSQGYFSLSTNADYTNALNLTSADGEEFNQREFSLLSSTNVGDDTAADNLAWNIINRSLSSVENGTSNSANGSNDVVNAGFVLISAGNDGIYFNELDLTSDGGKTEIDSFADVGKFDDIIIKSGTHN